VSEATHEGSCRCGKVRFEVSGAPLLTLACHCTGCQKMTASAFALTDTYPAAAFRLTDGEVVIGGIHGATRHHHCDYCKSWIYTEPDGLDDIVNVRSTLLDDPDPEPPFVEIFVGESLPWARTGAAHSYGTLPAMEEWPQLIQQFAGRKAVPAKEESNR
jgi:hypothetical protein